MAEMSLACRCGKLKGVATDVSPHTGNRVVCMCDDCQAYAHHLERSEEILDRNGGTEVFQMTPSQLRFTEGQEQLRCVRLGPKGLMRWYAGCCNTPVANTVSSAKVPFVGIPHMFMNHDADGQTADEALGPILARTQGRFGYGELPDDAYQRAPLGLIVRALRLLFAAWVGRKHQPSPLFDAQTGEPVVEPTVLSLAQRSALRERVRARAQG